MLRAAECGIEAQARASYVATSPVTVAAANLLDLIAAEEGQVDPQQYEQLLGEFKLAASDELGVNPPAEQNG